MLRPAGRGARSTCGRCPPRWGKFWAARCRTPSWARYRSGNCGRRLREPCTRSGKTGWIGLMRRIYKEQAGQLPFRRSRLRVILADDQIILRHGLRMVLDAEADLEV